MLTFRDMTLDDRDTVLPMVDAFYRSNAVDHPVPREIVERSFLAAAGNEPRSCHQRLQRNHEKRRTFYGHQRISFRLRPEELGSFQH